MIEIRNMDLNNPIIKNHLDIAIRLFPHEDGNLEDDINAYKRTIYMNGVIGCLNNFMQVAIENDDSGHRYIIPFSMSDKFDLLVEDEDAENEFNQLFAQYRIGGRLPSLFKQV